MRPTSCHPGWCQNSVLKLDLTGGCDMVDSILSKDVSVAMFGRGAFGNHLRQWDTLTELLDSGFDGRLMLRFRKPDGPVKKDLTMDQAVEATRRFVSSGKWRYEEIYYNEVLENQDVLVAIQGELMRDPGQYWPWGGGGFGLCMFYSTAPIRMREALRDTDNVKHAWRLEAQLLLQKHLDPSSYDLIMELLDLYPDHIIEFTCCKRPVGSMANRGRNTIVWEVRKY